MTAPEQYYQTLQISNLKQAIESKVPPLGLLKSVVTNGEVFIKALVILMIEDLVLFLNIGKTMNKDQINQTADLIIHDFNYLRIDDFKLCFNNAKKGVYGKVYDRLDGQIIFEWLSLYASERANEAERLNRAKKHEESLAINSEGQKKVIEILSSSLIGEVKEKAIIEKPKIREFDEKNKFIQECFSDFDKLHNKTPLKIKSGRFINYKGIEMDQTDYTQERLYEKYPESRPKKIIYDQKI